MDTPSQRYKNLVEELGREMRHRHGWKAEVARKLGVHNSMITRVLKGLRVEISAESVRLAAKGLGLSETFFYDDDEPTSYRDHQDALVGLFPTETERELLGVLELAGRVLSLDFVERARIVSTAADRDRTSHRRTGQSPRRNVDLTARSAACGGAREGRRRRGQTPRIATSGKILSFEACVSASLPVGSLSLAQLPAERRTDGRQRARGEREKKIGRRRAAQRREKKTRSQHRAPG